MMRIYPWRDYQFGMYYFLQLWLFFFGTAKLKNLGKDVGGAVKDFKKSIRDEDAEAAQLNEPRTLEHQNSNTKQLNRQTLSHWSFCNAQYRHDRAFGVWHYRTIGS